MRARHGFSLLELSVVLAIISLVAAAGISLASGALKAADRVTTQERLNTIKLALDSYTKLYGYLPCPADRAKVTTDTDFGVEKRTGPPGTTCTVSSPGIVSVTGAYYGGVPTRTLGLPDNYAGDAWGNKLTYAVSSNQVTNSASAAGSDGALNVRYGERTGTFYTVTTQRVQVNFTGVTNPAGNTARFAVASTSGIAVGTIVTPVSTNFGKGSFAVTAFSNNAWIEVNLGVAVPATEAGTLTWQTPGPAASYVVVSHGPDGRGAFPTAGTAVPAVKLCIAVAANSSPLPCSVAADATKCNDIENCNEVNGGSDVTFYDTSYNDGPNAAQYFDDYVVWGSNASARVAVNNTAYTSCTSGCESWCAPCTGSYNYPGAFAVPAGLTTNLTNPVLCNKVLYSSSTNCFASCFWSGTALTAAAGGVGAYSRCP